MVNLRVHYSCCYGADSAPLPVILELGMNVFVYCTDNFDGGELATKHINTKRRASGRWI